LLTLLPESRTLEIWDVNGKLLKTIQGEGDHVGTVFREDSQMLAVGNYDNHVRLWHRDQGMLLTLSGHNAPVTGLLFHPDNSILASVDENQVILHQLESLVDLDKLVAMGCERVAVFMQNHPDGADGDRTLCQDKVAKSAEGESHPVQSSAQP
jgi:WD40 repeat protein